MKIITVNIHKVWKLQVSSRILQEIEQGEKKILTSSEVGVIKRDSSAEGELAAAAVIGLCKKKSVPKKRS